MSIKFEQQSLKQEKIKLAKDCALTEAGNDPVVICHCERPWPHVRLYSVENYRQTVYEMLDFNYDADEIEAMLGEVFAVDYLHHHSLKINQESLQHLSTKESMANDVVLIYDFDGTVHVWDERTAPRDASDQSLGRYYQRKGN